MKKEQQKKRLKFTLDDGRRVEFDWTRFYDEFFKKKKDCNYRYKTDLFRKILQHLYPQINGDDMETIIQNKNLDKWLDGGGPQNLLEIYKPLAEFFGCEEDAFLKYVDEETKEEHKMNTMAAPFHSPSVSMVFPTTESKMIRAMERMKEKEAASELYSMFVDLIAAYLPVETDIWIEKRDELLEPRPLPDQLSAWAKEVSAYPERTPVSIAIRKAAPYLSKELRYQLNNLLEYMYGPTPFDWQDIEITEYVTMMLKRYEDYIKQQNRDPQQLDENDKDFLWYDMIQDEEYELYGRLDDIFADYLCD